jgi:hypothetical protein
VNPVIVRRLLVLTLLVAVAATLAGCDSSGSSQPTGETKMMKSGKDKQRGFEAPPPIQPIK